MSSRLASLIAVALLVTLPLLPRGLAAPEPAPGKGVLRLRNSSPFIIQVFIGGVRVGWVKPFRTELFKGLKGGYHKIYTHTEYGTVAWGPKNVMVPGTLNVELDKSQQPADLDTALAARVFQTNKASLVACGKIAERRGESLGGLRVEFEVGVSEKGEGKVKVTGEGIGDQLRSCYRAVVTQWKYPVTGQPYTISFMHMP